jgi:hypothetical protein
MKKFLTWVPGGKDFTSDCFRNEYHIKSLVVGCANDTGIPF